MKPIKYTPEMNKACYTGFILGIISGFSICWFIQDVRASTIECQKCQMQLVFDPSGTRCNKVCKTEGRIESSISYAFIEIGEYYVMQSDKPDIIGIVNKKTHVLKEYDLKELEKRK